MSVLRYVSALSSSLFRIAVFIFLRVIPSSWAPLVLPPLYIVHITSAWLQPTPGASADEKASNKIQPIIEQHHSTLSTIIFSLPTASRRLRTTHLVINTLLAIAVVDFAFTPFIDTASDVIFTRVGAVYPDSVKIVTRYPQRNYTDPNIRILWRESKSGTTHNVWKDGPLLNLADELDWVDTVKLGNLWPSTSYEYTLSHINGTILPYPLTPIPFHTFPDPLLATGTHFRFLVSSCVTPNFPYRGPSHRRTIQGFDLLADYIASSTQLSNSLVEYSETTISGPLSTQHSESISVTAALSSRSSSPPIEFLLFLGDFIYADVPLYIGDDRDSYRRLYRRNYQSESFRKIYERLPIFHTYDDHEFINNFSGLGNDSTTPYQNASEAFKIYNADANYDSSNPGQYYYDFRYGDVAFFVMDTRRFRSEATGDYSTRTMLGEDQLAALHHWLGQVNSTSTFKFIMSSVPFTSLWSHDVADSWAGFPSEKEALLSAFHSVPNVFILSGDRHEFAAIEFNSANKHTVREFSTSPLSMFYIPFVRTLHMQSGTTTKKTEAGITKDVPHEKVLKYIAEGNFKWSAFEIDTRDPDKPMLKLEVMIDGKAGYHYNLVGTPVQLKAPTALAVFTGGIIQDILTRFGMNPNRWF